MQDDVYRRLPLMYLRFSFFSLFRVPIIGFRTSFQVVTPLALLTTAMLGCGQPRQTEIQEFSGPTMGTRYSVRAVAGEHIPSQDQTQEKIDALLAHINRLMSTYDPESELSRFNQSTSDDWFPVSPETAHVVQAALEIADASGGAFDPTVGPAVNLWGFGPDKKIREPPSDEAIASVLDQIGHQHLEVRMSPPALKKNIPELYVDLSAIAKGYAVDAVSDLLSDLGFTASMVEIGGEVRTRGTKPGGAAWRIGVEDPASDERKIYRVLELVDLSLASSGDYRNYFELDGRRYSHTIDPRTARPVEHDLATVSVVANSAMEADALATTLMALGEQKGYDWCVEHEVAALLLVRDEEAGVRELATPRFIEQFGEN